MHDNGDKINRIRCAIVRHVLVITSPNNKVFDVQYYGEQQVVSVAWKTISKHQTGPLLLLSISVYMRVRVYSTCEDQQPLAALCINQQSPQASLSVLHH